MYKKNVVVIGAGPAGIMAAVKAAQKGHDVTLLEKNNQIGKKLLISGKGRCNITNIADIEEIINNTPGNGNFLYSSLYNFSNADLISFFNEKGLKTKVERGGRVFPESDRAKDVVDVLLKYIKSNNVKLMLNTSVKELIIDRDKIIGIIINNNNTIECDSVVIATGGKSYPGTGSTGDGYKLARQAGHTINELKPSLVPLITQEKWVKDVQGLTLKNVSIILINNRGKKIYTDFGEMIFTHFGVSGPMILSASRHIIDIDYKNVKLLIDLKPALTTEKLDERLTRDFDIFSRKQFKNSLDELLPKKLIPIIIDQSGIPSEKFVNQITKGERQQLAAVLKNLPLTIIGARQIDEAIVTAGGVSIKEVNCATMESLLIKGLFFAGEVLDVDAYTGGFNLTIAFSTGVTAGQNV